MRNRKHSLCFVDDDPEELQRFQESFKSLFVVGVGQTLDDALADLRRQGPRKPDLFVLDMYFPEGSLNTKAEQEELRLAWSEYNSAHANFMSVLARLRQTSKGGYALAENVQKKCRSRNYVFFTRKATL